jgi:hypothetical protein
MELAGLAGDALGDDFGVFVDEDGHVMPPEGPSRRRHRPLEGQRMK